MSDLKSLLIGIVGTLIFIGFSKAYKAYRNKSIQNDIIFLEFEKDHLEKMKRSSVEMNRSSFRAIFALFLFIGLANLIPVFCSLVNEQELSRIGDFLSMSIWAMFIGLCAKFWRRYDNLKNYKEAMIKMDKKIVVLENKLQNS